MPIVANPQTASEESSGNSLEDVSLNSNVVNDASFASIVLTSNRSELSNENERDESREYIAAEYNNNIQSSTVCSSGKRHVSQLEGRRRTV